MYLIRFVLLLLVSSLQAQLYTVNGTCLFSTSYCGGIAPSQEEYARLTAAKPYAGKVLYIKSGRSNTNTQKPLAQSVCDSLGRFQFKVKPGIYCIVQAEHNLSLTSLQKKVQGQYLQSNAVCLKQWWQKGLLLVHVKSDTTVKVLEFHQGCFKPGDIPCIDYFGPMPP
jgi:hypothetical protein